jgi:hypothetical protein
MRAAATWLSLVAGCAGAVSDGGERTVPTVPIRAPSAAPEEPRDVEVAVDPVRTGVALPPAIDEPKRAACTVRGTRLPRPLAMRLRPGGAVMLTASSPSAVALTLPLGSMLEGAHLEASGGGVTLRGMVNGPDVRLLPAKPVVMSGFVMPYPNALLLWRSASRVQGRVELEIGIEPPPVARFAEPPRARLSCDGVGFDEAEFEPRDAVPVGALQHWGELARGAIPLSRDPQGPVVATLQIDADTPNKASVHDKKGGMSRIVYRDRLVLLFGWVPSAMIRPTKEADLSGSGYGSGSGFANGGGHWRHVTCERTVPLVIDVSGERATVGEIAPATTFAHALPLARPWTMLKLEATRWFHRDFHTQMLARASDLEACKDAP